VSIDRPGSLSLLMSSTSGIRSLSNSRGRVPTLSSRGETDLRSPTSPITPHADISLKEMLGSATDSKTHLQKNSKWGDSQKSDTYSEEAADSMYIATYDQSPRAKDRESPG
jgi:hypothetical protein